MNSVPLQLPEDEAQALYRLLHRTEQNQEQFCETYRQLQGFFFKTMTVEEVTTLLESKP